MTLRREIQVGECFYYLEDPTLPYLVVAGGAPWPRLPRGWDHSVGVGSGTGDQLVGRLEHYTTHPTPTPYYLRRDLEPGDCFRYTSAGPFPMIPRRVPDGDGRQLPFTWGRSWPALGDLPTRVERLVDCFLSPTPTPMALPRVRPDYLEPDLLASWFSALAPGYSSGAASTTWADAFNPQSPAPAPPAPTHRADVLEAPVESYSYHRGRGWVRVVDDDPPVASQSWGYRAGIFAPSHILDVKPSQYYQNEYCSIATQSVDKLSVEHWRSVEFTRTVAILGLLRLRSGRCVFLDADGSRYDATMTDSTLV